MRLSPNDSAANEAEHEALSAHEIDAGEWDRFLRGLPCSSHQQASLWGELKAAQGWSASSLGLRRDGVLVAGVQLLHRTVLRFGRLGYVPRGPVLATEGQQVAKRLMQELAALLAGLRLQYVVIQPPMGARPFTAELVASGFRSTPVQVAPTATILIDVQQSDDDLLMAMRSNTRRGVRIGEKSALRVRSGGASDLPAFHALLAATGKRRGFNPPSLAYIETMWRGFSRDNEIVLLLVELDEELVAGELDLAFGDTLVAKRGAWSGAHKGLRPNELLVWGAIRWARERGLRYYDMDGLHPELAAALTQGTPPPLALQQSHHGFKASFGGTVVTLPPAHEAVRVPLLGWLHREVWCSWLSLEQRRRLLQRMGVT